MSKALAPDNTCNHSCSYAVSGLACLFNSHAHAAPKYSCALTTSTRAYTETQTYPRVFTFQTT